jgi:peptide/nickel transport system substrate-binding protein
MTKKFNNLSRRSFLQFSSAAGLAATSSGLLLPQSSFASNPKKGGHFVLGSALGSSTSTLDPALSTGDATFYALAALGNKLTEIDFNGNLIPSLAESWEPAQAGKVWHFKLRRDVEFHNGKTLTSDDVVKTIQRHSNEKSKSGALGIMKGIESVKADGNDFSVTLTTANADFPYLLTDYHLVIQPDGGMKNPAAGIGTGAYQLKDHEPGVRYSFDKFNNHWDASVGHYDSHEILVINDNTARVAALQSGQVHAIDSVPPKTAKLLARNNRINLVVAPGRGHNIFVMHTNTPPFDNKDLRLALKYAINREELVDKVLAGFGSIGNDIPINAAYPLFDDSLPQREFSLEKARAHYKKSGHDGSPIELLVSDTAFSGAIDAAQLFQQTANAAGIPLQIKRVPADGYWSEVWNKKPFCASYWGGRPVQDQMWSTGYLSTADWNDTRFNNPEFDALLLAARVELDQAKRKTLYGKMARIVWEEGGLINPMFYQRIDAYSDKIAGERPHPNSSLLNGYVASLTWFD